MRGAASGPNFALKEMGREERLVKGTFTNMGGGSLIKGGVTEQTSLLRIKKELIAERERLTRLIDSIDLYLDMGMDQRLEGQAVGKRVAGVIPIGPQKVTGAPDLVNV